MRSVELCIYCFYAAACAVVVSGSVNVENSNGWKHDHVVLCRKVYHELFELPGYVEFSSQLTNITGSRVA
ncbi:hypothetical protein ACET3Z_009335 [Daucus carota]